MSNMMTDESLENENSKTNKDYTEENKRRSEALRKEEDFLKKDVLDEGAYVDEISDQNKQTEIERPEE